MKAWHHGLPEATAFILFPPAGQTLVYKQSKDRVLAFLATRLPGMTFEISEMSLEHDAVVIPICGEAGDGGKGIYSAPPSDITMQEIKTALRALDLQRAALS